MTARYRIAFTQRAERELDALPRHVQRRIAYWLDLLADDPHRAGTRKLHDPGQLSRVHASKGYVIVYAVRRREVLVLVVRIGHRKDVYRGL